MKKNGTSLYGQRSMVAIARFQTEFLLEMLEASGGNVSQAARIAGMDRVYFHRLMRKHGVKREYVKRGE